jgi:hypothetical protein
MADLDRPTHTVTMRMLDADGHEVHSEVKGDARGLTGLLSGRRSYGSPLGAEALDLSR